MSRYYSDPIVAKSYYSEDKLKDRIYTENGKLYETDEAGNATLIGIASNIELANFMESGDKLATFRLLKFLLKARMIHNVYTRFLVGNEIMNISIEEDVDRYFTYDGIPITYNGLQLNYIYDKLIRPYIYVGDQKIVFDQSEIYSHKPVSYDGVRITYGQGVAPFVFYRDAPLANGIPIYGSREKDYYRNLIIEKYERLLEICDSIIIPEIPEPKGTPVEGVLSKYNVSDYIPFTRIVIVNKFSNGIDFEHIRYGIVGNMKDVYYATQVDEDTRVKDNIRYDTSKYRPKFGREVTINQDSVLEFELEYIISENGVDIHRGAIHSVLISNNTSFIEYNEQDLFIVITDERRLNVYPLSDNIKEYNITSCRYISKQ